MTGEQGEWYEVKEVPATSKKANDLGYRGRLRGDFK